MTRLPQEILTPAAIAERHVQIHYNPAEGEDNYWMYAMIVVGCAFVVFVIGSVYLMCKSTSGRHEQTPTRRHVTTRERKVVGRDDL